MDAESTSESPVARTVTHRRAAATLAVALGIAGIIFVGWGREALYGYALGLIATGICIGGLWLGIVLMGRAYRDEPTYRGGMGMIVLILLVKLPFFVWAADRARGLPEPGPGGFLAGLALVYCALVWWTVARR